jgi:hypothetical protein
MASYTLYLNKSVYTAGDSNSPEGMLLVTDDMSLQSSQIDGSNALNVATTLYQNQTAGGASDNLSTWTPSLATAITQYQGAGFQAFVLNTGFGDWDFNGTLAGASADAWLQTAAPVVLKVKSTIDVPTTSVMRLAKTGDFSMNDVVAGGNNPFWLSNDTRVFKIAAGSNLASGQGSAHPFPVQIGGGAWNASTAHSFVTAILSYMNNAANAAQASAIFDALTADEGLSQLTTAQTEGTNAVYNFAIARVHAVNTGVADTDAYVAFRLFSSLNANLAYDGHAGPNYRSVAPTTATPVNRIAAVGRLAANQPPFSIPCFGDLRTNGGEAAQTDAGNNFHFTKDPSGNTLTRTFYALVHVDINDPTPRFDDGTGQMKSVGALLNQAHVCTVAQIISKDLPTSAGATPQNSGDLAQRNTSIAYINNPGHLQPVRAIQQNFEFVPHVTKGSKRPNELLFLTKGVPEGTYVELFMPGLDEKRLEKLPVEVIGDDRVRFALHQAAKLPITVDAGGRYPALVTVQFPKKADVGKDYVIDVLQLDPDAGVVVGAFRLRSAVVKARKTLEGAHATAELARARAASAKEGTAWAKVLGAQAAFAEIKAKATALEVVRELHEIAGRHVSVILDRIEVPIARKASMVLEAAVYEGGELVSSHPVRIPAGKPGIVRVGEVVYDGEMIDHLAVKLVDKSIVRNARSWSVTAGKALSHLGARATSEVPSPSSWRVWYHVVDKH